MAKAKTTVDKVEEVSAVSEKETVNAKPAKSEAATEPSMQDMMAMFAQMQQTINALQEQLSKSEKEKAEIVKNQETKKNEETVLPIDNSGSNKTAEILERLVNKKFEREIILVHNRELIGGLSTSLRLNGLNIDFHTLGEQRVLTWQQAEECVSKYFNWFKKGIILLGPGCEDLAERYNVPCVKRECNNISKDDIKTIYQKNDRELEELLASLSEDDKKFVFSYWLGKCYENDANFVNRSKIEFLNRLSGTGVFDNFITGMNFNSVNNK